MGMNADTAAWLEQLARRAARELERKQDARQAPDEVIRRTIQGELVVTRRHGHAR